MKRKVITFSLLALLVLGAIVPIASKAAETWNYGYSKTTKQWYNHYYHSGFKHYGTITKNGVTYTGPIAQPGYWSQLNLDYNGPYAVTYNKYIIL
ncbi:lactococcin 972 family bacteriocin [Heyndrickxia sporothermodurans]|uniref:Lactococcin 972 family bacteriocin n=1 Tax=Heyndrickxia sporothermodurans TaxID=46224 RepID=A0A150KNR4_9BACI|nr:lactococcin 972 family bacteriocin [Heyndrickxia sporothermodurans]KYC98267.1 hypothetical protein B4102_3497 [Heyndrickxia sporothermodurans]MBL5773196.1 hypothetical protein [Heyndrickxia sporothermodurans]MBL5780189.1 hypothetical protein [Heyndrickxia sporothermodurans]MBL5783778.1 hypothetical protein [Heyndrickxia sporothermodurans]MBL5787282.1 hypothetical protein [Heyndrickxia sporothermodurans]